MANRTEHARVCPTRIEGAPALFEHRVTTGQCQDKQRRRYHKCFSCAYNNAYVAVHGLPEDRPQPKPVEPVAKVEKAPAVEPPEPVPAIEVRHARVV